MGIGSSTGSGLPSYGITKLFDCPPFSGGIYCTRYLWNFCPLFFIKINMLEPKQLEYSELAGSYFDQMERGQILHIKNYWGSHFF